MKKETFINSNGTQLVVEYGLQTTNHTYFSITSTLYRDGKRNDSSYISGGCQHEVIQKTTNKFDDLIKLHLSNVSGEPMYAVEDGFYHYCNDKKAGADYLRLSTEQAKELEDFLGTNSKQTKKGKFIDFVEKMKPIWLKEAKAVIEKFDLNN